MIDRSIIYASPFVVCGYHVTCNSRPTDKNSSFLNRPQALRNHFDHRHVAFHLHRVLSLLLNSWSEPLSLDTRNLSLR